MDLKKMQMSFSKKGIRVELNGNEPSSTIQEVRFHTIMFRKDSEKDLQNLLQEYASIFLEPKGLPPQRFCDHKIVLEPETKPIVERLYRYPHAQKDEIEQQCSEMLRQGIIRPSQSLFSSPVLLVPKLDGS